MRGSQSRPFEKPDGGGHSGGGRNQERSRSHAGHVVNREGAERKRRHYESHPLQTHTHYPRYSIDSTTKLV